MRLRPGPLRDALALAAVFALLLGILYVYTGTWPPAVIVESSSMMHPDEEVGYGRLGTIDPGDLVLVKKAPRPADVHTLLDGGKARYRMAGDVVIYFPYNDHMRTPIIHRAVAFVDVRGTGDATEYFVRWNADAVCEGEARKQTATQADVDAGIAKSGAAWCVYGSEGVYAPSVPISRLGSTSQNPQPYRPEHSGYLTKGDNPFTNRHIDQVSGLSPSVKPDWVQGTGRAELPWLGLIKLSVANKPNERNPPDEWVKIGAAYAPKDLWVMLGVSLFVLVGVPLIYDGYKAIQARRRPPPPPAPPEIKAASSSPTSMRVDWEPIGETTTNYRVYRDGTHVGSTGATLYVDEGLEAGREYAYHVVAVDDMGNDGPSSSTVRARTQDAPEQGTP